MANGFYSVEYWIEDNRGIGLLLFRNGKLLGYDIGGGSYTGTYKPTADHGCFVAEANVEFQGGVLLVSGDTTPEDGLDFNIEFTFQKYGACLSG